MDKLPCQKRVIWSDYETETMLRIVQQGAVSIHILKIHEIIGSFLENIIQLLAGKRYRKLNIYQKVSKKLKDHGFIRCGEQIRTKLKALRKEYLAAKKKEQASGNGKTECNFYNLLDEIFGSRPIITSVMSGTDFSVSEDGHAEPESEFDHTKMCTSPILSDNHTEQSSSSSTQSVQPTTSMFSPLNLAKHFPESFHRRRPAPPPLAPPAHLSQIQPSISASNQTVPPKKKLKHDMKEYRQIEEYLMAKNHKWWDQQFEKQRKHEREQAKLLHNEIRGLVSTLTSTIRDLLQPLTSVPSATTMCESYTISNTIKKENPEPNGQCSLNSSGTHMQ